MEVNTLLYVSITVGITMGIILFLQYSIKAFLRRRRKHIDKLENVAAIPTDSPLKRPLLSFKVRAEQSLKRRFTIFNRVAIVIVVITVSFFALFPFIDRLPQTLISIVAGSTAIIIGVAAKPFIENFLSGVVITFSKKLNIGDTITIDGHYGTIEDISSTHTVLKLWDWRRYIIPNSTMINNDFINYSLYDEWFWTHVVFYVAFDADLEVIKDIAIKAATTSEHFSNIEDPSFWVIDIQKDAIKCWLAAWASSPDRAWELRVDMRTYLIMEFRKRGIKTHLSHLEFNNVGNEALTNMAPVAYKQ